jgi:chlorite dismutase
VKLERRHKFTTNLDLDFCYDNEPISSDIEEDIVIGTHFVPKVVTVTDSDGWTTHKRIEVEKPLTATKNISLLEREERRKNMREHLSAKEHFNLKVLRQIGKLPRIQGQTFDVADLLQKSRKLAISHKEERKNLAKQFAETTERISKIKYLPAQKKALEAAQKQLRADKRALKKADNRMKKERMKQSMVITTESSVVVTESWNKSQSLSDVFLIIKSALETFMGNYPIMKAFPKFLDYCTTAGVCIYQLTRARNVTDVLAAIYMAARIIVPEHFDVIIKVLSETFDIIKEKIMTLLAINVIVTESATDVLTSIKSWLSKLSDCELLLAFQELILTVCSYKIFDKNVAKNIYRVVGKPKEVTLKSTLDAGLTMLISMFRFKDTLSEGVPLTDALLLGTANRVDVAEKTTQLLYDLEHTYTGLPVKGRRHEREVMLDIEKHLEFVTALHKRKPKNSPDRSFFNA